MHKDLAYHVECVTKKHEERLKFFEKVSDILEQCIKAGLPTELHNDAMKKTKHPLVDNWFPLHDHYVFRWAMMNWQYINGKRRSGNGYGSLDVTVTDKKTTWIAYYKGEQFILECNEMPAAIQAFINKHKEELELR